MSSLCPRSQARTESSVRAVGSQVGSQVDSQVDSQVGSQDSFGFSERELTAIRDKWVNYIGGQFWVGDWAWWGSPCMSSFALDVLRLDIGREIELAARAYAATASSACWWMPLRDVIFVSERPSEIKRKSDGTLIRATWDGWSVTS